jgi:hypothetical protein
MTLWVRSWTRAGIAVLAVTSIPEIYAVVQPSGVANGDVCASVGRRVSVGGCTNVADTVNAYVPPPADYAPLPQDFPPPPPPVNVCFGVGRRFRDSDGVVRIVERRARQTSTTTTASRLRMR